LVKFIVQFHVAEMLRFDAFHEKGAKSVVTSLLRKAHCASWVNTTKVGGYLGAGIRKRITVSLFSDIAIAGEGPG
jgi:hypothetical protein